MSQRKRNTSSANWNLNQYNHHKISTFRKALFIITSPFMGWRAQTAVGLNHQIYWHPLAHLRGENYRRFQVRSENLLNATLPGMGTWKGNEKYTTFSKLLINKVKTEFHLITSTVTFNYQTSQPAASIFTLRHESEFVQDRNNVPSATWITEWFSFLFSCKYDSLELIEGEEESSAQRQ